MVCVASSVAMKSVAVPLTSVVPAARGLNATPVGPASLAEAVSILGTLP